MRSWLVVEDEPSIYDVLHSMFQMWGVEGIACNDGEQAFALIDDIDSGRYRGQLPEMAVVDVRMPGKLDGIDVGRRIRQSPRIGHIAIVLISAYVLREGDKQEAIARSGADTLIVKPLPRPSELRRQLEAIIAGRKPQYPAELPAETPVDASPKTEASPGPDALVSTVTEPPTPSVAEVPAAPTRSPVVPATTSDKSPDWPRSGGPPLRRRVTAPRPPVLPEIDDDEMTTREQTQDLPRLRQADTDTQPAANAGLSPRQPTDDE